MSELSGSLKDNPRLDRWVAFLPDRSVRIGTGKVELGQGILTALAQIAAEELDLRFDQVRMMSGNSVEGPGEGYTASSWSIEHSGAAIRQVCAEVRAMALDAGGDAAELRARGPDGRWPATCLRGGAATGIDYWSIAAELDLERRGDGRWRRSRWRMHGIVGTSVARSRPAGEADRIGVHPRHGSARTCCTPGFCASPGRGAGWSRWTRRRSGARAGPTCGSSGVANFVAFVERRTRRRCRRPRWPRPTAPVGTAPAGWSRDRRRRTGSRRRSRTTG